MKAVNLIFPHQLFEQSELLANDHPIYLIEEHLFFNQYNFHKQKLVFHRATMKCYQDYLTNLGKTVHYIDAQDKLHDVRVLLPKLKADGIEKIFCIDPTDDWLTKRIVNRTKRLSIEVVFYENPLFINTTNDLAKFFDNDHKFHFQTKFYKSERKRLQILLDDKAKPVGGKWTFDAENRKKYPKKKTPPSIQFPDSCSYHEAATKYVEQYYPNNLGSLTKHKLYPINFEEAQDWLDNFLQHRFHEFGTYEDAIIKDAHFLNHSVLTPMLNVGLLLPETIVDQSLAFAETHQVPINSLEGFVRQLIGWREFMRGIYQFKSVHIRNSNYWNFKRKIPSSFYDGTTGIEPIDATIKKVLKTGYCHHIERLMILGNFMLLCEFDPNEVYRWFMELFIDAYDWVMVSNVYSMSQFADGGLMATKPYISGSNYVLKMSDYKKDDWSQIWDSLFWRFMHTQRNFFEKNPRLNMLLKMFDKRDAQAKKELLDRANNYLASLQTEQ